MNLNHSTIPYDFTIPLKSKTPDDLSMNTTQKRELKLSITGELFQSHNDLVPNRAFSGELMIEEAKKYWEANLENCDECKSEYLFQGHAKILEKIK